MDAWQQQGKLAESVGIDDLQIQLQRRGKEKVRDFWDPHAPDQIHRTWLSKEWWQHVIPEDRLEDFFKELTSRKIPIVESPDVIRWGYTNRGTFLIKEAFHIQQSGRDASGRKNGKKSGTIIYG